jgi:N-acetyl-alpha-D-muramate 1-phosphate uridylyltransferase
MYKAMIFAAGLGTRLHPLTHDRPKGLVELCGKTLLQRTIDKLTGAGVSRIVVNIHHFPGLMREALDTIDNHGAEIMISDESHLLLDTGGGLTKAAPYLEGDNPFIVHNVDVVSDIDLTAMYRNHCNQNALATLAVSVRPTSRYFLWDRDRLCGWENIHTHQKKECYIPSHAPTRKAFSGIHIIDPKIFSLISEKGVFPINTAYLRLAKEHKILSYTHDAAFWADVGTLEKLKAAEQLVIKHPEKY